MTTSWVPVRSGSPFPIQNLPLGSFSPRAGAQRIGVAIGDRVLDVAGVASAAPTELREVLQQPTLNSVLAAGRPAWQLLRATLAELLTDQVHRGRVEPHLYARDAVTVHLPFGVGDYVDFYSSLHHAENVGRLFRPDGDPLTPNWRHLPIGYHGRAGTVVVSGTPIVRPCGQRKAPTDDAPTFGPSTRLDIEAEVGFVVGTPSQLGHPVTTADLLDHVFGVVLVNDWSARDLQAWEYVPLGPLLGKSFATSVSPWVVPLDALSDAHVQPPAQQPAPLPYLTGGEMWGLDLDLEVMLNGHVVSRPPFRTMYWTPAQQLAHLTVNGASVRTGDLLASGTVSGQERGERGSLLELSWNGTEPLVLPDGSVRTFLEDGDTVSITATAPGLDGSRIGFGEVAGTVRPARC